MDINTNTLAIAESSTIFQRGLITPPTLCYFLQENTDNNKNTQKEGIFHHQNFSDYDATMLDNNSIVTTPESPADDDFSFSLEEFEKRYVPLSHLPTPPLSDSCSMDIHPTGGCDVGGDQVDAEFWGPAKYLVSMVPRNASREPPSAGVLAAILQRANLKLGVISLACCVLDCLSDQFLRQWRRECCSSDGSPELPEVLAVAALMTSMKFMEDSAYSNKMWTRRICEDLFTVQSLNLTERLVLADLNYCLLDISKPEFLDWNIVEIQRYIEETTSITTTRSDVSSNSSSVSLSEGADYFSKSAKTAFPLSEF
ncbi:hypothetical protein BDD12DRAFT_756062 [Trichophaea hybrida]|nr:hypothetical protein BDD12DRAFT_756062 [Trichophaea hybrida]